MNHLRQNREPLIEKLRPVRTHLRKRTQENLLGLERRKEVVRRKKRRRIWWWRELLLFVKKFHKFVKNRRMERSHNFNNGKRSQEVSPTLKCYKCNQPGHIKANYPSNESWPEKNEKNRVVWRVKCERDFIAWKIGNENTQRKACVIQFNQTTFLPLGWSTHKFF